jgi:hypothetical protein
MPAILRPEQTTRFLQAVIAFNFDEAWTMTTRELVQALRALPRVKPDPIWKQRVKRRLLQAYDRCYGPLKALRHWAVYVSAETDVARVADAIVARGHSWRPVAVRPERAAEAVRTIEPALVVVDSRLPESERVVEEVRGSSSATVVTDYELVA